MVALRAEHDELVLSQSLVGMRARARGGLGERVDEETTKTKNGERRSARVETLRHDSTRKSALERVSMLYKYEGI